MSSRKIDLQRCFKIPKDRLDLFLVKLNMESDRLISFEAEYVFNSESHYDVVVNVYGSYPAGVHAVEEFANELNQYKGLAYD